MENSRPFSFFEHVEQITCTRVLIFYPVVARHFLDRNETKQRLSGGGGGRVAWHRDGETVMEETEC